jgi:integrase
MATPPELQIPAQRSPTLVVEVIDAFLDWTQKNRGPRTYDWYKEKLQIFADTLPKRLSVSELKPYHVAQAMDSRDWTNNGKHNLARSAQRAFNWAEKQGLIDRSPIRHVEKPPMEARELYITPADFELVMVHAKGSFRDLIRFAWESGARPQEIVAIERRHVDFDQHRVVFPRDESKGKKSMRVIYLTAETESILKPLAGQYPTGPLFRTAKGTAWRGDSVNCAFCRLQKKIGKKFHLGAFRKGYTTQALKNGVDTISVAALLGHKDAVMVSRVYAKVSQDPEHMAEMARRATRIKREDA